MDFTQKLKALREDHDETQRDLANYLSIKHQQYQRYETGTNEIPIRYLKQICEHYGTSADYLLGLPKGLNWPR